MLIFDGSNVCHIALESFKAKNGYYDYEQAIPYCLAIIAARARKHRLQDAVFVAFDNGIPLHRRELLSEYKPDKVPTGTVSDYLLSKINKDPSEVELGDDKKSFLEQYPKLTNIMNSVILPLSGCISVRVENCEADDIIAYWVKSFPDLSSTIISSDRDLLQLITDNVCIYEPRKKSYFHLEDMEERGYIINKFKEHFLYTKAIIGDKSDNIEGIDGVGDKNALLYAKQIVESKEDSLQQTLATLQRNPRANQKALDRLKISDEVIQRNYKLMDLEYTQEADPNLIKKIRRSLLMYSNRHPDYNLLIEKLHQITNIRGEFRDNLDTIFDSNFGYDKNELLQRIV